MLAACAEVRACGVTLEKDVSESLQRLAALSEAQRGRAEQVGIKAQHTELRNKEWTTLSKSSRQTSPPCFACNFLVRPEVQWAAPQLPPAGAMGSHKQGAVAGFHASTNANASHCHYYPFAALAGCRPSLVEPAC